jgi:hypothetical protein
MLIIPQNNRYSKLRTLLINFSQLLYLDESQPSISILFSFCNIKLNP